MSPEAGGIGSSRGGERVGSAAGGGAESALLALGVSLLLVVRRLAGCTSPVSGSAGGTTPVGPSASVASIHGEMSGCPATVGSLFLWLILRLMVDTMQALPQAASSPNGQHTLSWLCCSAYWWTS